MRGDIERCYRGGAGEEDLVRGVGDRLLAAERALVTGLC